MVSREIESRIPTAAKLMMRDEPPALMNGRVMPVMGTSVTTTAMLMNAWMHSQAVMPAVIGRAIDRGVRTADVLRTVEAVARIVRHEPAPDGRSGLLCAGEEHRLRAHVIGGGLAERGVRIPMRERGG